MDKKNEIGWMESHKYLALFIFAGVLFFAAQVINFIFFASYREAITQAVKTLGL